MKSTINNILEFLGYALREKFILLSLVGYILIFISPMFSWYVSELSYTGVQEDYSYNMFQLSGDPIGQKSYIAIGIVILVLTVGLVVIEYMDFRKKLRSRLDIIKIVEVLIYIALIILVVVALQNEALTKIMNYRKGEIEVLEYWVKSAKGHCSNGVGPILYIIGILLAIFSKVGIYIISFISNVKDSLTWKKK